ncbi:hypothetical protein JVU11DRAFT_7021 [Chiua virens]|nr:hypothetical protein JVU11DRAFT_7021 [Chiua virens]
MNFLANLTADDITTSLASTFNGLTESLYVKFLNFTKPKDVPSLIFNVFTTLPTSNPKAGHNLHVVLKNITYLDPFNSTRRKGTLWQCQICQCITHSQGLCPFP